MRLPTPLLDMDTRIPEAGRIRLGVKTARGMTSIDTFRFTSPDDGVIRRLAELYGGEVKPWRDAKASPPDQWEVITKAKEIDVYLPSNALSVWYELWSGGGVQRRCDGEACQVPQVVPGGWEMQSTPCICLAKGGMECRPYTRMNVILPTIPFRGVWRLETKGWNAAKELPGMVQIIEAMTQSGRLVKAKLHVERRAQQTAAGKRNFVVPGVTLDHTAQDMIAGAADVRAITVGAPAVATPALESSASLSNAGVDDIIDAEIVDDGLSELEERIYELGSQHGFMAHRVWAGILLQIGVRGVASVEQTDRVRAAISKIESGALSVIGFNPDGSVIWKKH